MIPFSRFGKTFKRSGICAATAWCVLAATGAHASTPQSANVLKFAQAGTLLLGDSKSATVYAYEVGSAKGEKSDSAYNLKDFGTRLAKFAKTDSGSIIVRDMAVNPGNQEVFIAFDVKGKNSYTSRVVAVNQAGTVRALDLKNTKHSEKALTDAPTDKTRFWDKTPMRSLTITDMRYFKGKIYVSGMSNAEFSSALRVMDFPFSDRKTGTSSVEIFHGVHNQNETRAPIQTMQFLTIGDADYILAAYTCTPLVLIPLKDIQDGAHVVGKTIAEMGYGNTPVDMIKFSSQGFDKKPYEGIILSNRQRSASFVNVADIAKSATEKGIGPVGMAEKAGTASVTLPLAGLLQLDDQSPSHIAALRRDPDTGSLELVSFLKNVYIRLEDFVSEYDQPGYVYAGDQLQMKGMQNMIIQDAGLPKFVKP